MVRPTFAQIDVAALKSNYRALREFVTPASAGRRLPRVIAVVKANAYGHGAVTVARALEAAGASMLACADIEEGVQLRRGGVRIPILVFGALSISDLAGVFEHRLTPTVSSPSAARALHEMAARRGVRLHCHLKVDTGMNRFGFRYDNLRATLPDVLASRHLVFEAVYTHFATADESDAPLFEQQQRRFDASTALLSELGLAAVPRHAANSAALLRGRRTWLDAVRPGLLLYGAAPARLPAPAALQLQPVLSLHSRIVAVKGMRPGETSGYGARFRADRPTRVAVVPAGYADGLDVRMAGVGAVLVRGRRAPIVGSVCMDSITIDVTEMDVSPGDRVVLIGTQGGECIGVGEVADWIGTVPHEVLCRTGSRIERVYSGTETDSAAAQSGERAAP